MITLIDGYDGYEYDVNEWEELGGLPSSFQNLVAAAGSATAAVDPDTPLSASVAAGPWGDPVVQARKAVQQRQQQVQAQRRAQILQRESSGNLLYYVAGAGVLLIGAIMLAGKPARSNPRRRYRRRGRR